MAQKGLSGVSRHIAERDAHPNNRKERYLTSSRWSETYRPAKCLGVTDAELELIRGAMRMIRASSPHLGDQEIARGILVEIDEAEKRSNAR